MSTVPGILVVEDEKNVGSTLVERLQKEAFSVDWAQNAAEALSLFKGRGYSLALLDVGLPDGDGFDLARKFREQTPSTAIVFLTAFGTAEDRVTGLEIGADDYVVKPFHFKELLLRIRNVLKRADYVRPDLKLNSGKIRIGRAMVDFERFEAVVSDETHKLTHKECALLKLLHDNEGRVVSRDEILDRVWSEDEYPSPRTVDNFIMRIRRLVENDPENPKVITSLRGVGYQLK